MRRANTTQIIQESEDQCLTDSNFDNWRPYIDAALRVDQDHVIVPAESIAIVREYIASIGAEDLQLDVYVGTRPILDDTGLRSPNVEEKMDSLRTFVDTTNDELLRVCAGVYI